MQMDGSTVMADCRCWATCWHVLQTPAAFAGAAADTTGQHSQHAGAASMQLGPGTEAKTEDQEMQLAELVCSALPESVSELQKYQMRLPDMRLFCR